MWTIVWWNSVFELPWKHQLIPNSSSPPVHSKCTNHRLHGIPARFCLCNFLAVPDRRLANSLSLIIIFSGQFQKNEWTNQSVASPLNQPTPTSPVAFYFLPCFFFECWPSVLTAELVSLDAACTSVKCAVTGWCQRAPMYSDQLLISNIYLVCYLLRPFTSTCHRLFLIYLFQINHFH